MNKPREEMKAELTAEKQKASPSLNLSKMTQAIDENMKALAALMDEEMTFLAAQNMEGLSGLRERKAKLLRDYQTFVMTFSQKPALLKAAPEETRARLRETGQRLAAAAERNAKSLQAAVSATQSVLEFVMNAAREDVKKVDSYTDPRKKNTQPGAYSPTCAPVAVNRTA